MALLRPRSALLGLLAAVRFMMPANGLAQTNASLEIPVKAAFLHKLTLFVEWPAKAFPDADGALKMCVLNDEPFSRSLAEVIEGEEVGGRKLALIRINGSQDPKTCHVLFMGRSDRQIAPVLVAVRDLPVLTVGEQNGFLEAGGNVNFLLEDGKVRFEINLAAVERAGLQMSSKILRLATRVVPGEQGGR